MGPSTFFAKRLPPSTYGATQLTQLRRGPWGALRKHFEVKCYRYVVGISYFTVKSCGYITSLCVIEVPVRYSVFVVSGVFYIYAALCVRVGKDNGEGAEVAIPCPVDIRSILLFTSQVKPKGLEILCESVPVSPP